MISSQQIDGVFEFQFQSQYHSEYLNTEATPINIISKEKVFSRLQRPSGIVVDYFYKIIELSVDVSHDRDRVLQPNEIGLNL
jgi:hypothetical protein